MDVLPWLPSCRNASRAPGAGTIGSGYAAISLTGEQQAVFDLAWPSGIQEELSQPVAVLLNEAAETLSIASRAGFRCFTEAEDFRRYVLREILAVEDVS